MKRQWIVMCVSACLVCCLFVLMPTNSVHAANGSEYYKNVIVYLYPSNATSTSNAQLYSSFMVTGMGEYNESDQQVWRVLCKFLIRNTTSQDLIIPSTYIGVTPTFTWSGAYTNAPSNVEYVAGQLMVDRVGTSGKLYFSNAPDHALNSNIIVPALGDISCVFYIEFAGASSKNLTNFNFSWDNPSIPFTPVAVAPGDVLVSSYEEYLKWIYFRANTIYDALINQAQSGSETVDTGEDTQTEIETIHGEEQTWFTQTETDIEGTGLSTFSFTGDASTGITGVKDQFVDVWNAMGIFTIVPIFALSLKLAATIIRHVPARKNPATSEPAPGREIGFISDLHNPSKGVIWRQ